MCPALIHAAAFDSAICRIALIEPLISYGSIVMNRYYNPGLVPSVVAGALSSYDLPDITACIAPRKLLMANIADQSDNEASSELIEKEMKIARSAYAIADSEENLAVKSRITEESIEAILSSAVKLIRNVSEK